MTIENVEVNSNAVSKLDVSLNPESFGLDEVFVEARMIRNNDATLLRERQKSGSCQRCHKR